MNKLWVMAFLIVGVCVITAQTKEEKSHQNGHEAVKTTTKTDTAANAESSDEIMDLGEISIQGRVEKPGVVLIPRRVESEIKERSLERSFTQELKSGNTGILQPKKALNQVEQVQSIKSAVKRKRKKTEKK